MNQIPTKRFRAGSLVSRWRGALAFLGLLATISISRAQVTVQTIGGGVRVECGSSSGFVAGNTWTNAQFNQPWACAMDTQGDMWIADLGNSDIELVTAAGDRTSSQTIQFEVGTNRHPIPNVIGVAVDSSDDLYVLTTSTLIEFYNAAATFPDLVPLLEIPLSSFSSSPATALTVVNDSATNIYITFASSSSGQIVRIPQPYQGPGSAVNIVNSYSFTPAGITMQANGKLAVSDTLNDGIYQVDTLPGSTPILLTGGYGPGFANGPPTAPFNGKQEPVAYFNSPHGIVASADGRLAVCDTGNSLIRVIDTNINTTTLYGTTSNVWTTTCCTCSPTRYAGWVDGTAGINSTNASGRSPVGCAISTNGTFFVTEAYYSLLRAATGTGLLPVTATNGSNGGGGTSTNPPTLVAEPPSSITPTSATLSVGVDPNGSFTTVYFQYGANSNALSSTPPITISNSPSLNVTNIENFPITGLPANSVIYYQAVAYNSFGYSYGSNYILHTTAVGPSATTEAATNITSTGATLNGSINPNGAATSFYFEYGPTTNNFTNFTATNSFTTNFFTNAPVSAPITGLAPGTTNYFQLVAFNDASTNFGGDLSFVTPVVPPTLSFSPSNGYFPECETITVTSSVPDVYYTEDNSTPTTNSASVPLTLVGGNYVGTFQWCNPLVDLKQLQIIAVTNGVATSLSGGSSTTNILGFVRSPGAGIGSTAFIPIVLDLRSNDTIQTLQFLVEVTPSNGAPALAPISMLPITSNDFVQLVGPSSGNTPVTLSTTQETNSFDPHGQALLVYSQGLSSGLDIQNYGVVGLLQVQVPVNAAVNNQYTLSILYPSGTAAGGQIGVPVGAMTSQTLTVQDVPYLVGDSAPAYGYDSEEFGDGILDNRDVNNAIFASLGARVPPVNSDAYNAMDAYPPPIGDGVINFADWNLILLRSVSLDLPNWLRYWTNNGALVGMMDPTNTAGLPGNPAVPTDAAQPQGTPPGQVWATQATITSSTVTYAQPGANISLPVYLNVKPGNSISGFQFRAIVTPVNGAPVANQATLKLSGNIPSPDFSASHLVPGNNDVSAAWTWGTFSPNLQNSSNFIGSINFQIPANAQSGQCYALHFAGVSGGLDETTDYTMESWPGYVWVGTSALQQPSIISDDWKIHFFGSYSAANAADNVDPDGDGMLNWQEYLAGTDPTNPKSALQFSNAGLSTNGVNGVALNWLTAPGKKYVLQAIPALGGGNWTAINTNTGDGYNYQFIETQSNSGAQFYRIVLQP